MVDVGHGDICQCHCLRVRRYQRALAVVALDVVNGHSNECEEFCGVEDWGTSTRGKSWPEERVHVRTRAPVVEVDVLEL